MNLASLSHNRIFQAGGGLLAAAVLLTVGGFIGNAMADDHADGNSNRVSFPDEAAISSRNSVGPSENPMVRTTGAANEPSSPGPTGDLVAHERAAGGSATDVALSREQYYGFCEGSLGDIVSPGGIDLSASGFNISLLPASFTLHSFNIRAEHDCDDESVQWLVLDTSSTMPDGQYMVWISQRENAQPTANVMRDGWAEFWRDGYTYSVSIGLNYHHFPSDPLEGDFYPYPEPDPAALRARLSEVVGIVAPDIGDQCFYRQGTGDWSAFAQLGIGDPRGAIPRGFAEAEDYFWVEVFDPPAAGCDNAATFDPPLSFNASFADGRSGWLSISAYRVDSEFDGPWTQQGYSSEYNVSWTTGGVRFEVYGNRNEGGLGVETLETIARAMDPAFDQSCRLVDRKLSDTELSGKGIGLPAAPDGFELVRHNAVTSEANANCTGNVIGHTSADWTFRNDDGLVVSAYAWLDPNYGEAFPDGGYIGYGSMNWQSATGVAYSVSVYSEFGGSSDDDEAMLAVAQSLDPALDLDTLNRDGGGGFPRPLAEPGVVVD